MRGWLRRGGAPSWRKPKRGSILDPFMPEGKRRWAAGGRNAMQLWREVAAAGFAGRYGTVHAWTTQRRDGPHASQARQPTSDARPSGRRVGRLLMADPDKLADSERQFVGRLLADAPKLAEAVTMAKRLHRVLRKKDGETLDEVLAAAVGTLLAGFAARFGRDKDAVQAALNLPWTTSPVEGQVNRIKTIKRSMYGRAAFDLLRARVLQAA